MMKRHSYILFCVLAVFAIGSQANAQFLPGGGIDTPNPNLPPDGVYLTPDDVHAMYTGADLAIVLTAIQHRPFVPGDKHTNGVDEEHNFNSLLTGTLECQETDAGACAMRLNGLPPGVPVTFTMTGPVHTVARPKPAGTTTGTFQTEMLSMDLTGFSGMVMIRESPSRPSLGSTRIADNGNGTYHIDSFFDVFTELSIDGGLHFDDYVNPLPTRVNLVPEPTSIALAGFALVGLAGVIRRRR